MYQWVENGKRLECWDAGDFLFDVDLSDQKEALIRAYHAGCDHGEIQGRVSAQFEMKKALGLAT